MYTEFIFGCELSINTPKVCIDALDYIINRNKAPKYENPQTYQEASYNNAYIERTTAQDKIDKFISQYDLGYLLGSSSYYFGAANPVQKFYYDSISDSYHISTRSDLKNYQHQIEKFIKYIKDYVTEGSGFPHGVFAYVQYEESEFPTIYAIDGIYKVPGADALDSSYKLSYNEI